MGYQSMLFEDEFKDDSLEMITHFHDFLYGPGWSYRRHMRYSPPRYEPQQIRYGGIKEAFKAGNVVLEIGSGEAVALMAFSLEYPDTTFIGVDQGYNKSHKVNISQTGLQLTHDDWSVLKEIPDKSIDTILSLQSVFTWGFETKEEAERIMNTLNRVAKVGCILRCDLGLFESEFDDEQIVDMLKESGWEEDSFGRSKIFRKMR